MKIYTKTGDKGETGLWSGERIAKSHPRVAAYGDVDELNSCLGAAVAALPDKKSFSGFREALGVIQEELFDVGARLATPPGKLDRLGARFDHAAGLEWAIDKMTEELEPMRKFILPGGSPAGAWLHLSRAVCRRAERAVVALGAKEPLPDGVLIYLNRLSDYLFTAARWVNAKEGRSETEWEGLSKRP